MLRVIRGTEKDLLQAFLEHIPDGVYFKDRTSRFVRISRSLAARFGLSDPAEAINKTDFDMFTQEHARQAFADEQEIVRTGQPIIEKEEKETWPDGRESWVLTTKLPLVGVNGQVLGTMGISRDITDRKRIERELEAYRAGLEELVKSRTAELVRTNLLLEQDIAARKVAEQELAHKAQELASSNALLENLALIDDLTGLYNRKGFLALADHRSKLARRTGEPFSIAFIDLDGLKQINDTFGHQEGDRALIDAADMLKECFRESDVVARLGGDEFALFVSEADDKKISARVMQKLASYNARPDRRYPLSFSIGVVSAALYAKDFPLEVLLAQADAAMYREKRRKQLSRKADSEEAV